MTGLLNELPLKCGRGYLIFICVTGSVNYFYIKLFTNY